MVVAVAAAIVAEYFSLCKSRVWYLQAEEQPIAFCGIAGQLRPKMSLENEQLCLSGLEWL